MPVKFLKKKTFRKIVFWGVAIIIIISFGLAGQAYLLSGRIQDPVAGELFGQKVPLSEFNRHFKMTRFLALNEYGAAYSRLAPSLDLETQTWERLMLLDEAKRRRIKVTDNEVRDAIRSFGLFQSNGEFNYALYEDRLSSGLLHMTPKEFEQGVRETLMIQKLYSSITLPVSVSEDELRRLFHLRFDQAKALTALFAVDAFLDDQTPVDDVTLKEYFLTHRADFIEPEAIRVGVLFKPYPLSSQEPPSQEKTLPPTPSETEETQKADGQDHSVVMQETETIARLLAEERMDPQEAAQRFDGWQWSVTEPFTKDQPILSPGWPLEIVHRLFELKEGEWVGPFETDRGVAFATLIERRPQRSPAYPDVKDKVLKAYRTSEAKKKAQTAALEFIRRLKEQDAVTPEVFRRLADQAGAIVTETPLFKRPDYLPGLGIARSFKEAVFKLDESNPISQPIEVQTGVIVALLLDKRIADENLFAAHKAGLKRELLLQKRNLLFSQFFSRLKKQANLISRLDESKN